VWPPGRPNSTRDNSLWGTVKKKISQFPLTKTVDIKTDIRDCFDDFQLSTWKISKRTRGEKLKFVRRMEGRMQITSITHRDDVATLYIAKLNHKRIKQIYNQHIAHIKNRKHSYMLRLLHLAISREYQY
jgi:hypothetical protein